ncbi:TatD family hydrolase [Candidatus Woesearchaeota archaeon]|nr:TatD family hydrolase [Candidatus Woesearchaeota archaeon]
MFVDVHCHLSFERFHHDLPQVLQRAADAGVTHILCSGVDHETNEAVLNLAEAYPILKASLGVYPLDAVGLGHYDGVSRPVHPFDVDGELALIEKNKKNVFAIGEIGLDKSVQDCKLAEQKEVFWKCIHLAEKLKKPIVVHTRKAELECIEILESSKLKRVDLHCFTGNLKLVKKAADLGFMFSIPAVITRLQHFQSVVKEVPLSQLLTETDAPYLAPVKDGRSEPADVVQTVKIISQLKGITSEEARNIIFSNFQRMFLLKEE